MRIIGQRPNAQLVQLYEDCRLADWVLAVVKIRRNLATKSAVLHGCKRETAALSAMRHCICPYAASRVRFARLHKAAACP